MNGETNKYSPIALSDVQPYRVGVGDFGVFSGESQNKMEHHLCNVSMYIRAHTY